VPVTRATTGLFYNLAVPVLPNTQTGCAWVALSLNLDPLKETAALPDCAAHHPSHTAFRAPTSPHTTSL